MLRGTDDSVASIAAALGYSSQTAFAAAFRKLTQAKPRAIGGGACISSNRSIATAIALGQRQN